MIRALVFAVVLLTIYVNCVFACGQYSEPTTPVVLSVEVEPSKLQYSKNDTLKFTVTVKNMSSGPLALPVDLGPWLLPITVLPGGGFNKYKCIPPAPECDKATASQYMVLQPGEGYSVVRARPAFIWAGEYKMGYALHLFSCDQVNDTQRLVAVSPLAEFVTREN